MKMMIKCPKCGKIGKLIRYTDGSAIVIHRQIKNVVEKHCTVKIWKLED